MNTGTELLHRIAEDIRSGDVNDLEMLRDLVRQLLQSEDEMNAQLELIDAAIEICEIAGE